MATFVKLTNGDIVNVQHIKSIKRHEHMSARAVAEFLRENQDDKHVKTLPSIELQLGSNQNPLLLKYESEQERDTEFERIEAVLLPKQKILFKNLLLNPELIQSMLIESSGHTDSTLKLRIKVSGIASFVVSVNRDDMEEWKRAEDLIAKLGLAVPKTMRELMKESRQKGFGSFS